VRFEQSLQTLMILLIVVFAASLSNATPTLRQGRGSAAEKHINKIKNWVFHIASRPLLTRASAVGISSLSYLVVAKSGCCWALTTIEWTRGKGTVDNASGVAAVLQLLAALKARPLSKYNVSAVFFDLHEAGLFGAMEYLNARRADERPDIFVNVNVFAYGDGLWVMSTAPHSFAAEAFRKAASNSRLMLELGPKYPVADHMVFLRAHIETLSISLLDRQDILGFIAIMDDVYRGTLRVLS
jgi:hypothetical protein